ncbi:MAG: type II secretion system F family protein [Phycisphaerales bacterium]|nr:MAG: type II secretion system F family protein [Phycisphaerales bacterium]
MGTFSYIARDGQGQKVTGTLTGGSEQAILSELQSRHLAPIQVREVAEQRGFRRGLPVRVLSQMYGQLADLLRAGVPLLRALRLLGRSKANPRLAKIMSKVADEVADGTRLADAMAVHEDVFPPIQVAMVRAGERGGFLEDVLERMGDFLEQQADMRAKVIGSLIYPAALILVGLGIVIFALVFFVPQFEGFYSDMDLPLPTQILLMSSAFLTERWLIALMLAAALVAGAWWAVQQADVRRRLAAIQMRVPKLGPLLRGIAIGRFTRILGTLLENGIPLIQAMQISRDAAGNVLLAEAIDEATEAVRAGESLADPLARSGLFNDDIVEMIAVGESANNLATVLVTIAETIEKRVDRMLSIVMRLVEPLLLLSIAGVVLFIFIALIVPMLQMSTSM